MRITKHKCNKLNTMGRAAIPLLKQCCGNWFPGAGRKRMQSSGRKPPFLYFNLLHLC